MDSPANGGVYLQRAAMTPEYLEALGCENGETGDGTAGQGYGILQDPWELSQYLDAIRSYFRHPINYLEIGLGRGGLFRLMAESFELHHCVGIDNLSCRRFRKSLEKNLHAIDRHIDLLPYDSTSPQAVEWLCDKDALIVGLGLRRGLMFEIVFVDGDHSYEGVKKDVETFAPWIAPGGWLVFHDTIYDGKGYGVRQVTQELQGFECLHRFERQYGIGVFVKG